MNVSIHKQCALCGKVVRLTRHRDGVLRYAQHYKVDRREGGCPGSRAETEAAA